MYSHLHWSIVVLLSVTAQNSSRAWSGEWAIYYRVEGTHRVGHATVALPHCFIGSRISTGELCVWAYQQQYSSTVAWLDQPPGTVQSSCRCNDLLALCDPLNNQAHDNCVRLFSFYGQRGGANGSTSLLGLSLKWNFCWRRFHNHGFNLHENHHHHHHFLYWELTKRS